MIGPIPINRSLTPRSFTILYADDILLIAPSISELQRLFNNRERELEWLDMRINVKNPTACELVLDLTSVVHE